MKEKTARRFLSRNWAKIARINLGISDYSPSFKKRLKECARILSK